MPNKTTTKTTATSSNPRSSNYVPKTTTTSSTSGTKSTTSSTPSSPTSTKSTNTAAAQTAANTSTLHAQTSPAFGGPTYTSSTSTKSSTPTTLDTLHAQTSPAFGGPSYIVPSTQYAQMQQLLRNVTGVVADTAAASAAQVAAAKAKEIADQNQADADMNATNNNVSNTRSGSGGGGSSYDSDTAALQQQLNNAGLSIAVDGIWGPETQAAYEQYINQIYNYGGGSGGSGWPGGGKHNSDGEYPISQLAAVTGAMLPGYINPIGSPELENLHMGDRYDLEYDYDNILNILDNATKNKYNELWNQYSQTENAYYNQNLADQSATLDNIKRAQAAATMSGASKGMQAAQMLSSILTGQQTNAGNQLELANVRNNTALSEQTELAENKNTALTTSNAVKQAIAGLDETKYGYDAQMRIGDQDYNAAIANAIGTILAQGVYAGTLDISDYEALLNSLYPQP